MLTKTIKTTNGPLKVTIPSDRSEITIGMLMDLTPDPGHSFSPLQTLSILSGIPTGIKEIDGKEYDLDIATLIDIEDVNALCVFDETIQKLAYQLSAFEEVQAMPEFVLIEVSHKIKSRTWNFFDGLRKQVNVKVKVISNLGIAPAGAYMEAKEVIKAEYERWEKVKLIPGYEDVEFKPSIEAQIRLLSLYFYVPATGEKFNTTRAAEFDEVIKKMKITEALPIARHFFLIYPNLSKQKVRPSLESLKVLRSKPA